MHWEWIVVAYAAYFAAIAWGRRYPMTLRWGTLAVLAVASLLPGRQQPSGFWPTLAAQAVPAVILLGGYRLSGLFFVAPMRSIEERLLAIDRRVFEATRWMRPTGTAARLCHGVLELAYLTVYAIVPAGAIVLVAIGASDRVGAYWTVVLTACFSSYALLPWIQTRPPRAMEMAKLDTMTQVSGSASGGGRSPSPPRSLAGMEDPICGGRSPAGTAPRRRVALLRRVNLAILRSASNQVNTIPSGHAAAALAVALMIFSADATLGLLFLTMAAAIAAATVVGRYHYTLDTVAGAAVALASWFWLGR
jgi:PAP2 superfamily protein